MNNVVRVSRRLIPIEQIALFEPFVAPTDPPLRTTKEFKARIVLLDRGSVLAEEPPEDLAGTYGFRMISEDRVATNPAVKSFRVETFEPSDSFQTARPFKSRLVWEGRDGNLRSKLLIAAPATVLAIAVRGELDTITEGDAAGGSSVRANRSRARRKPTLAAKNLA